MVSGASCSERLQTHTFLGSPKPRLLALLSPFLVSSWPMSLWSHTPFGATLGSFSKTRGYVGVLCMHDTHFARCQPAVSQPARSAYPLPSLHPCLGSHLRLLLWSSTVCMLPAGRLCRLHPPPKKTLKEPCGRIRAAFITERGGFSHPPQRCGCRRTAPGSAAEPQRERCGALRTTSGPVQPSSAHYKPVQPSPARPSPGAVPGVPPPPPRSRRCRSPLGGGGHRSQHHEPDGDRVAPGAVPILQGRQGRAGTRAREAGGEPGWWPRRAWRKFSVSSPPRRLPEVCPQELPGCLGGDGDGVLGAPGPGMSSPLPPASPLSPGSIGSCCLAEVWGDLLKSPGRFVFTEKPLCRDECLLLLLLLLLFLPWK